MHRIIDQLGEAKSKSGSPSSSVAPSFVVPLNNARLRVGQPLCLECRVTGHPMPEVRWEKSDTSLVTSENVVLERDGEWCRLKMPCCTSNDVGEYICMASNLLGSVRTSALITTEDEVVGQDPLMPNGIRAEPLEKKNNGHATQTDNNVKKRKRPPHFLLPPRSKMVSEGENVRFLCSYTGYPEPELSWFKDQLRLSFSGDRLSLVQTESLYILQINSVVPEDGGDYILVLENELGKIEASAHLEVKAKNNQGSASIPKILRPLTDCVSTDEESWTLTCEVTGNPTPSIRWYKDGKAISQSGDFKMVYDGHEASLVISEIYPDDQGQYTCLAKNTHGEAKTSCFMTVREAGSPPSFVGTLQDLEVTDGDKVTFTVQIKGTKPIEVIWVHNDQEIKNCKDFCYVSHEDGITHSLVIEDVFLEDAGLYVCEAYNHYGDAETLCKLSVRERFPIDCQDENIQSTCDVTQAKECTAERRHSSREINTCFKNEVNEEEVKEQTKETEPNVKSPVCRTESVKSRQRPTIENGETQSETECMPPKISLKLISAQILKGPQSLTVLQGESVTLEIQFSGTPKPSVTWIKSGRIMCCNDRVKIKTDDECSTLFIQNSIADDSGKYVVTVENSAGSDCGFASVAVVGPPDPPAGQPNVSKIIGHSVVLTWYGATYDGGSIITGYVVEMCRLPRDVWEKISVCHSTCLVVNKLSPGKRYRFRVRTENAHGLSRPSKESEIVLISDDASGDEEDFEVFDHRIVNLENGSHFPELYELKEEIGRGRFGTVYRCIEMATMEERAAKVVKCLKTKDKMKVREEIDIMNRLRHPKLLQLAAAFENPRDIILVMEYICGGELFERIIADDFVLTEDDCILFMHQICEGVSYMHQNSVIHLDLKPENILCKTKTSHQIKIIDFGLARVYDPADNLRILFGTPEFVAPEVISYEPVSPASDMWSLGVICYVLLSGLSPFMGDNDAETFTNITRSQFDFDDEAFDGISDEAKDFITKLLIKRPNKRMTASECLKHPWLMENVDKKKGIQISTDKLKKFIIRRKWQKSGNAIRAIGRMVSLTGLSGSRSSLGSFSSASSFGERSDSETSSPTSTSMSRFSSQPPIQEYMEGLNKHELPE
ncbi:myosin light chain kinase, smooth muscle-like [Centruroides sculpturatus]|uniref:myosin light chain kinase, smooth muscle-like n=1 Tax=Centruroides sculpturatus TaxID=218467 RepID=UPI000C6E200C|nr:myosin light chain kinase, smooth muscle-like [Centruroides sculpturatus]XP_023226340.1 myosin light chain kinase, smooth muscle-like [Centruroides sculpturatus]